VAQISDTHIGDKHAPHAAEHLRHAVDMINDRHPDVVILSGDFITCLEIMTYTAPM
jgi:3',5'-cyclic AMP phosphodiesterase CpdA